MKTSLIFISVLMFMVCFVFPLTVNHIAMGFRVSEEIRFFTVMFIILMVVCFTIWALIKVKK